VLTVFNGLLHEKASKIFNSDKLSTVSGIVSASVLLNVTAKSKRGNEHMAYFRKLCTYIGCSKTSKSSDKFWQLKEWRGLPTSLINTLSAPQFMHVNNTMPLTNMYLRFHLLLIPIQPRHSPCQQNILKPIKTMGVYLVMLIKLFFLITSR
jgi:hypothetical protein